MRPGTPLVSLALVAAITMAAFIIQTGPEPQSRDVTVCNSPGVTHDQINLGFVFSDSGIGSSALSSARSGIDARIGRANEEGGIHGRRIVYDWRDDGGSPSRNALVTDELVRSKSVFGLVTVTAALDGSIAALADQRIPVVGFAQPTWAKYPNLFSHLYAPSPETVGQYIQSGGGTKVAVITTGIVAFTTATISWYQAAFHSIGLMATAPIPYARGSDSPARPVQQLAEAGVDSLIGFTTPEDLADIMQAARAANLNLAVSVSLTGYDRALLPTLGPALAGVSLPVYFRPFEAGGPAIDRYRDAMTRFAPQTATPDQQFAMYAYIYTDLFLHGLDLAGDCPTRDDFIRMLRNVPRYDAGGLIEPVDLRSNATRPIDCTAFVQIDPVSITFRVTRERLCAAGSSF